MNAHSRSIAQPIWRENPAPDGPSLCTVAVARTLDELMQAVAIRSAVYMAEQHCPYAEEFDGNDFAGATHLVAHADTEPVGCLRVRWFADFFKIERVAVLPLHRGGGVALALMEAAIALGGRKGYRRLCGHVTPDLVGYWRRRIGTTVRPGRPSFCFSNVDYVEVELELPPAPHALDMNTDPMVLLRPEGDWDRPGVLERSIEDSPGAPTRRTA
jgi:GNAT superfamily N-acetyltransferase